MIISSLILFKLNKKIRNRNYLENNKIRLIHARGYCTDWGDQWDLRYVLPALVVPRQPEDSRSGVDPPPETLANPPSQPLGFTRASYDVTCNHKAKQNHVSIGSYRMILVFVYWWFKMYKTRVVCHKIFNLLYSIYIIYMWGREVHIVQSRVQRSNLYRQISVCQKALSCGEILQCLPQIIQRASSPVYWFLKQDASWLAFFFSSKFTLLTFRLYYLLPLWSYFVTNFYRHIL